MLASLSIELAKCKIRPHCQCIVFCCQTIVSHCQRIMFHSQHIAFSFWFSSYFFYNKLSVSMQWTSPTVNVYIMQFTSNSKWHGSIAPVSLRKKIRVIKKVGLRALFWIVSQILYLTGEVDGSIVFQLSQGFQIEKK